VENEPILKKLITFGNVLDLWIVFLEGSQSIHGEVSYPQIQNTTIAFGSGVQTVGAFCQTLARVRDDIPRHVYIPEYASQRIGNGSDDPYSIVKSQQKVFKFNQKILSELDTINALDDATPQHLKTWAAMSAFNNYGFKRYQEEVLKVLENEGYLLTIAATPEDVELVKAEVTAKAEINYQAQCQAISEAPLLDPDQYQTVKNKRAKSKSERLSEKKTAIARRYCTEDITPSLIINDVDILLGVNARGFPNLTI
jgi:hypothetical protein